MNGYVVNIEKASLENENFRKVLYTTKNTQLVVMSLKAGEEIGKEVHHLDQFIRIESASGKTILNGVEHDMQASDHNDHQECGGRIYEPGKSGE